MGFIELATNRYSVREFSSKPVEDEKIEKILQAAKVAPTAVNYQPQKLYVIKSQEAIEKLSGFRNIFGAPLAVIVCYDDTLFLEERQGQRARQRRGGCIHRDNPYDASGLGAWNRKLLDWFLQPEGSL